MIAGGLSIAIELVVSLLLAATIVYCIILERRLKQFRADESVMRRTIAELAAATHSAERAIDLLKQTVSHADASLAGRLESAERFAAELAVNVRAGEEIVDRVRQIVETSRRAAAATQEAAPSAPTPAAENSPAAARPDAARLAATAIVAERLAERARARQRREAA